MNARMFLLLWVLVILPAELLAQAAPAMPGKNVPAVKVDTVGYPADWKKIVIFNQAPKDGEITVQDALGRTLRIENAVIREFGKDEASQDPVWQADLSALTEPGRYVVVAGKDRSDPFEVAPAAELYGTALKAGLKHFYFQRCRTALKEPWAVWDGDRFLRDSACHVHEGVGWDLEKHPLRQDRQLPPGGWHDAGNYDMYVPSTGPTAQALLRAYESRPELFKDGGLNIPESGNGVPDILDEAAWGLRWVLFMQRPDGGVRHREAVMQWSSGLPDQETTERWLAGVGTASTAKACALYAQAARVFRPFDEKLAQECHRAANRAWDFLRKNQNHLVVDGHGSPQPLWDDDAEHPDETGARLNAAVEMWRTFHSEPFLPYIQKLMGMPQAQPPAFTKGAWVNLARWPLISLAEDPTVPAVLRDTAKEKILAAAKVLRKRVEEEDGYRCATEPGGYYWGHNSNLMEKTDILLAAARLEPSSAGFLEAARDQWHWVLGRNPNGFSMITRVGKAPTALYHLEWGKEKSLPPGYLVGGPNGVNASFLAPGAPAKALLWDNPSFLARSRTPAGALWHSEQTDLWEGGFVPENQWNVGWWTVTEPDIYYNANFVLVAAQMQQ